jgi:transcriptional regulator with XRE-family HTH domain
MPETFGQALHRWRTRRRVSLRALARTVPCSHGHLWDIEQGSRQVTPQFAARLDEALGADGALIAIAGGAVARTDEFPPAPAGVAPVAARLADPAFAAAGAAPARTVRAAEAAHDWLLADPEPLHAVRAGGRVGAAVVEALGCLVAELRRRDDEEGGADLVDLVEPEIQFVARLMTRGSYAETVSRTLHLRLAELAELAGWVAYDAGRYTAAPRYFEAALAAAQAAGDRVFGSYVLAMWGFAEADLGRPSDAVTMLRSAEAGLGDLGSPRVHAVLGTWEARAAARGGKGARRQFERTLARAGQQFERDSSTGDPDWAYWMIQPELTAEAGRGFALVGDWRNAVAYLTLGLAALGTEYPRDRALYLSYLAEAYLIGGELDRARDCAREAAALLPGLRSPRVAEHLESVEHRLAA